MSIPQWNPFIIPGDNGAVRITFSDYSVGEHVLTLNASDAAGKTAMQHNAFTVVGENIYIIRAIYSIRHQGYSSNLLGLIIQCQNRI